MTMHLRAMCGAALVLWMGLAVACEPKPAGSGLTVGQTTPVPILAQFAGSDSGFTTAQAMVIHDADQLDALGSQDALDLEVDYDSQCLVLVTLGEMPTDGYGVTIHAIQQQGDRLYVQTSFHQPGEDEAAAQVITSPYTAAVIAKTTATRVQIEPSS